MLLACHHVDKRRDRSQSRTRTEYLAGIQRWSYYHDLAIQSGRHNTIVKTIVFNMIVLFMFIDY
jgi:hypothetical protein